MTDDVKKARKSGGLPSAKWPSAVAVGEVQKPRRGRPTTGTAKSSTDRGKAADEALVQAGGLILNKVRLSPQAATALADLVNLAGGERGAQRSAIENALISAANSPPARKKKVV